MLNAPVQEYDVKPFLVTGIKVVLHYFHYKILVLWKVK
jgi:hypothetical protein